MTIPLAHLLHFTKSLSVRPQQDVHCSRLKSCYSYHDCAYIYIICIPKSVRPRQDVYFSRLKSCYLCDFYNHIYYIYFSLPIDSAPLHLHRILDRRFRESWQKQLQYVTRVETLAGGTSSPLEQEKPQIRESLGLKLFMLKFGRNSTSG